MPDVARRSDKLRKQVAREHSGVFRGERPIAGKHLGYNGRCWVVDLRPEVVHFNRLALSALLVDAGVKLGFCSGALWRNSTRYQTPLHPAVVG